MYFPFSTLVAIPKLLPILSLKVQNMNELNRKSKRQHFTVLLGTGKGAENSLWMCVSEHRKPLEGSVAPKAAISNLRPKEGLHACIDGTAQKCSNTNCSLQINQSTWIFIFLVISELIFFPQAPPKHTSIQQRPYLLGHSRGHLSLNKYQNCRSPSLFAPSYAFLLE